MNRVIGFAMIAQRAKIAFQPLLLSIRVNWEYSSNCVNPPHPQLLLLLVNPLQQLQVVTIMEEPTEPMDMTTY